MKLKEMKKVEEIVKENFSRIIKIHYKANIRNYTSLGYLIPCHVHNLERKLVNPDNPYIKICRRLDSNRNLIKRTYPPKINIKDIYWIEVLDYLIFHKKSPPSDIVEVCFEKKETEPEEKETRPEFTRLFTLNDKKNIKESLEEIKKMNNSKYPSLKFGYENKLVVLKRFS